MKEKKIVIVRPENGIYQKGEYTKGNNIKVNNIDAFNVSKKVNLFGSGR